MDVILLERIGKLGGIGDVVTVKPGFARNYLIPTGRALRANDNNRKRFEAERANIEARNAERKSEAERTLTELDGRTFVAVRSAGETGQLYGSVAARDVVEILAAEGVRAPRNQINLKEPIKKIGIHPIGIQLHPEVEATITINVARTPDEASRQAQGEDLTSLDAIYGEVDEDDRVEVDEFFDDEAQEARAGQSPGQSEGQTTRFTDEDGNPVDPGEAEQPYV